MKTRTLALSVGVIGIGLAVTAWLFDSRRAAPDAITPNHSDVASQADRVTPTVDLERPSGPQPRLDLAEAEAVPSLAPAPAQPPIVSFEEKYARAEPDTLVGARIRLETHLHQRCQEIATAMLKSGQYQTIVLPAGESYDPGPRPFGWAETIRGKSRDDGSQEMLVAGFSQAEHPETRDAFAEMLWLGQRIHDSGSVGLLNAASAVGSERR